MIVGIGTDIVEVSRVMRACESQHFLERMYTEREQSLLQEKRTRCATNFAVKEAVVKMLGTGFRKIWPKEVEVLRDSNGRPYVILHGQARLQQEQQGIHNILVTLSDTKEYAVAYVIGEAAPH